MKRFGTFDDQRGISMGATRRHLAERASEGISAINLSSSSLLPSFLPFFLLSDERKSFRDTGSATEGRERQGEREPTGPTHFWNPCILVGGRFVVQGSGWENGMLRIFASLRDGSLLKSQTLYAPQIHIWDIRAHNFNLSSSLYWTTTMQKVLQL